MRTRHIMLFWLSLVGAAVISAAETRAGPPRFVHKKTIDLSGVFGFHKPDGTMPRSLTCDGSSIFIGGANYGSPSVGIVRLSGLLEANEPQFASLTECRMKMRKPWGYDSLVYDPTHKQLVASYDFAEATVVRFLDPTDGKKLREDVQFLSKHVTSMACSPVGPDGTPFLCFVLQEPVGDRQLGFLSFDKGAPGDWESAGFVEPAPETFQRKLRSVAFDEKGNIAIVAFGGIAYGTCAGPKADGKMWTRADGTPGTSSIIMFDDSQVCMVGQSVACINAGEADSVLVFSVQNKRVTNTRCSQGTFTDVVAANLQIRRIDGSTQALTQISLAGDEKGIGSKWSDVAAPWSKTLWYGTYRKEHNLLLVLENIQKRLDVYEVIRS